MKVVRVFLRGGLGNQFFQWLHASRIAMKHPDRAVVLDTSFLRQHRGNQALGQLELNSLLTNLVHPVVAWPWAKPIEPLLSRLARVLGLVDVDGLNAAQSDGPLRFQYGYYQTAAEYPAPIERLARSLVRPALCISPMPLDYAALHVRSGDYLKAGYNRTTIGSLTASYYAKACAAMAAQAPGQPILVISDDLAAAARLMPLLSEQSASPLVCLDTHLGRSNTAADALHFLLNARYLATANSSFSAMAAYLGKAEQVFAPHPWFRGGSLAALDPSRDEWQRLPAHFNA